MRKQKIQLTSSEIKAMYDYATHCEEGDNFTITQSSESGIGLATIIQVTGSKIIQEITDYGAW